MESEDKSIQIRFERDENGDFLIQQSFAELPNGVKMPFDVLIVTASTPTQTKTLAMPVDKELLKTNPSYLETLESNALKFVWDFFD